MVSRTYLGLGSPDIAATVFEKLGPFARNLLALRHECVPMGADCMAIGIAMDGLQTAAYHFTRRRYFYPEFVEGIGQSEGLNGRLHDRAEALSAFNALAAYAHQLRLLQGRCRPFGRDYLALDIARQSLETAAFHFTGVECFYGAKGDSAGPTRSQV
jgi:hypothetical protein